MDISLESKEYTKIAKHVSSFYKLERKYGEKFILDQLNAGEERKYGRKEFKSLDELSKYLAKPYTDHHRIDNLLRFKHIFQSKDRELMRKEIETVVGILNGIKDNDFYPEDYKGGLRKFSLRDEGNMDADSNTHDLFADMKMFEQGPMHYSRYTAGQPYGEHNFEGFLAGQIKRDLIKLSIGAGRGVLAEKIQADRAVSLASIFCASSHDLTDIVPTVLEFDTELSS